VALVNGGTPERDQISVGVAGILSHPIIAGGCATDRNKLNTGSCHGVRGQAGSQHRTTA
jgi:hypothetical protein